MISSILGNKYASKLRLCEVTFQQSYGGSGTQAKAVINGLEADVVALTLGFDVEKIQKLIKSAWENKAPNAAIVTRSANNP